MNEDWNRQRDFLTDKRLVELFNRVEKLENKSGGISEQISELTYSLDQTDDLHGELFDDVRRDETMLISLIERMGSLEKKLMEPIAQAIVDNLAKTTKSLNNSHHCKHCGSYTCEPHN